jgi:hypothetical protein
MAETWNRTASDNHHMFSDVCRWFFRYVAGFAAPDFQNRFMVFTPDFLSPLTFAQAHTETPAGEFFCRWDRKAGGIHFTCRVPSDFSVDIRSPGGDELAVVKCEERQTGHGGTEHVLSIDF